MSATHLAGIILTAMIASPPDNPAEIIPADPLPLLTLTAIPPSTPPLPNERPDSLPNIDPRLDIPRLIRPDPGHPSETPAPDQKKPESGYDPNYLYIPERNPGLRQPPCPCLPLGRWWVDAEYFLGITQNDSVPALATLGGSPLGGTPGNNTTPVIGQLLGNERLNHPFRSGIRVSAGLWLDRCQNWGIEGSFFDVSSDQSVIGEASNGSPVLSRPYFVQPGGIPANAPLALPGQSTGSIVVTSPLSFLGADANLRHNLICEDNWRLDFLGGYRYLRMSESLTIDARTQDIAGPESGLSQEKVDSFHTVNFFNGLQIGLAGEYRWDRIYFSGFAKTAFGMDWHWLDVSGWTRTQAPGSAPVSNVGGFLTGPSNIGHFNGARFAVVPETNLTLGYQLTDHWRAYMSYTFIYINSIARPGQAIDTSIGATSANVVHPIHLDTNTDFWMQGINFGLQARY